MSGRRLFTSSVKLGLPGLLALSWLGVASCKTENQPVGPDEDPAERPAVAAVSVTPADTSLYIGNTLQFAAAVRDAGGALLQDRTVAWSSNDPAIAAVDASGLVSALVEGAVTIKAASEGVEGYAQVTVQDTAGPPPPPPPPPPATGDTLFYEDFESGNLNAWDDIFETQGGNYSVVDNASDAYEGTKFLRAHYPRIDGGAGAMSKFLTPGDRFYARVRVKFSSNWEGNTKLMMVRGSPTQWGSFGVAGQCPDGTDFVAANVVTAKAGNPGPLRMYTYFLDMAHQSGDPTKCWGNHGLANEDPAPGPTPLATYHDVNHQLAPGQWHTLELEVQLNTVGSSDGWQKIWANGTLVAEWVGMRWRTDPGLVLQAFTLENSAAVKSRAVDLYFDDILLTTGR